MRDALERCQRLGGRLDFWWGEKGGVGVDTIRKRDGARGEGGTCSGSLRFRGPLGLRGIFLSFFKARFTSPRVFSCSWGHFNLRVNGDISTL